MKAPSKGLHQPRWLHWYVNEYHPRVIIDTYTNSCKDLLMTLSEKMEFDHVVEVRADGTVTDAYGVYAPEYVDDALSDDTWSLMTGYSGQHGYSGPVMHNSEYIGGKMERDILESPGFYVAIPAMWSDDEVDGEGTVEGWIIAYKPIQ